MKLSDTETKIIKKMKSLPHDNHEGELFESTVVATILYGNERNRLDEILDILESSDNLDSALDEIFKDEEVEIVDDDEDEE